MRKYRVKLVKDVKYTPLSGYVEYYLYRLEVNHGDSYKPNWGYVNMFKTEDAALSALKEIINVKSKYEDGAMYFDDRGNPIP